MTVDDIDLNTKLLEIARTVQDLQRRTKCQWVSCRAVAKTMEGSEELEPTISGYVQLPEARDWFRYSRHNGIMLTEKGVHMLESAPAPEQTPVQRIVGAVKHYAGRIKRQRLSVEQVVLLTKTEKYYVQALQVDLVDDFIPSETPVEFRPKDYSAAAVYGRVVGREPDGAVLYIAFEHRVHEWDLPAYLYIDHAFLLHELARALEKIKDLSLLSRTMFAADVDKGIYIAHRDSAAIGEMLSGLKAPWVRYLWGPPGAGKTYALGRMCIELLQRNPDERILFLGPSNLAVDNAIEQLLQQLQTSNCQSWVHDRKILRFGYPRKPQVLACPEVLGSFEQDALSQKVEIRAERVRQAEQQSRSADEIAVLRAELLAAQEELKCEVNRHVAECNIVATTTTLAYLPSSPVAPLVWDTVLIDEVTMVPPATCVYLGSRAKQRVLLAGDPRQLGPVFIEDGWHAAQRDGDEFEWMGRDVFDKSGISQGQGEQREIVVKNRRLARITSQRRCAAAIWGQVQHLYPAVENCADESRSAHLVRLAPLPGQPVVLLDTSAEPEKADCTWDHHSWQNAYSAELALLVSDQLLKDNHAISVAIITPYRAQVKLLRKQLRARQGTDQRTNQLIEVGTIHQFQGSEADVVIFDMVDGVPRRNLGTLLRADTGLRLVNVAITRARGKLIVIANRLWCAQHMQRSENPLLWDLIMHRSAEARLSSVDIRTQQAPGGAALIRAGK